MIASMVSTLHAEPLLYKLACLIHCQRHTGSLPAFFDPAGIDAHPNWLILMTAEDAEAEPQTCGHVLPAVLSMPPSACHSARIHPCADNGRSFDIKTRGVYFQCAMQQGQ